MAAYLENQQVRELAGKFFISCCDPKGAWGFILVNLIYFSDNMCLLVKLIRIRMKIIHSIGKFQICEYITNKFSVRKEIRKKQRGNELKWLEIFINMLYNIFNTSYLNNVLTHVFMVCIMVFIWLFIWLFKIKISHANNINY